MKTWQYAEYYIDIRVNVTEADLRQLRTRRKFITLEHSRLICLETEEHKIATLSPGQTNQRPLKRLKALPDCCFLKELLPRSSDRQD